LHGDKEKAEMKKVLKLLIFPILAVLWMVAWACIVFGERKREQEQIEE
jgi:hypothetical protein